MSKINKLLYPIFLALFLILCPIVALSAAALSSPSPYNIVQVFIQTSSRSLDYYVVSAYNSTGYLVALSQTSFPAASFELPDGNYLLTVTAMQQSYYSPYPLGASAVQMAAAPSIIVGKQPTIEYGYSTITVSGSNNQTRINILTKDLQSFPTSKLTIHISFPNGSAASDASVYASILGNGYWWSGDSKLVMWNNTVNGDATLVTPSVPVLISSWAWLPVNLPQKETTIQVKVAGELVNVTVYWQPTYVGFAGEALIIPPTINVNIMLHSQPPSYWVVPNGVQTGVARGSLTEEATTIASSPGGIPSYLVNQLSGNSGQNSFQFVSPTQIPSLQPSSVTTTITRTETSVTTNFALEPVPITTAFYIVSLVIVIFIALLVYSLIQVKKIKKDVPTAQ